MKSVSLKHADVPPELHLIHDFQEAGLQIILKIRIVLQHFGQVMGNFSSPKRRLYSGKFRSFLS